MLEEYLENELVKAARKIGFDITDQEIENVYDSIEEDYDIVIDDSFIENMNEDDIARVKSVIDEIIVSWRQCKQLTGQC